MAVSLKRMPPGVCDHCGRYCMALHQVDATCYHCYAGIFVHRSRWEFADCQCGGTDIFCPRCHGRGVMVTARKS